MRQERGPIHLLVIAEVIILVIVSVLGVVESFKPKETSEFNVEESSENSIPELPTEQEGNSETAEPEPTEQESESEDDTEDESSAVAETFPEEVETKVASMTTEEKVAQLFVISPEALTGQEGVTIAGEGTKNALAQYPVGGLVYSNDNYVGDRQAEALLAGAEQFSNERSGLYLWLLAAGNGQDGRLMTAMSNDFEAKPLTAYIKKEDAIRTLQSNESVFFPIHFPENQDLIDESVFCVMISNAADVSVTGQEGVPCCLSKESVDYLRSTLHYSGLIMTDTLSAEAVASGYSAGEAAVLAVQAGVDLIYQPADFAAAYQAVLDAVNAGGITSEQLDLAVKHILSKKLFINAPAAPDSGGTASGGGNRADASSGNSADGRKPNQNGTGQQAGNDKQPENNGGGQTPPAENNPPAGNSNSPAENNNPPVQNEPPAENNNPPQENNPPENGNEKEPGEDDGGEGSSEEDKGSESGEEEDPDSDSEADEEP